MRLLKEKGYRFNTIIAAGNGPLFGEFEKLSDICCKFIAPQESRLKKRIRRLITVKEAEFEIAPFIQEIDFVFSNTLANGHIIQLIRKYYTGKIFSYVHELESIAATCTSEYSLKAGLLDSDQIFVPCRRVSDFLQTKYGVENEKIKYLDYYIPSFNPPDADEVELFKFKHSLKSSFIVGGLGNIEWRKGTDIFIEVAKEINRKNADADIQFMWMGGDPNGNEYKQVEYLLNTSGLKNKIILIPNSSSSGVFLKNISLLLLTSREDAYPVVVLEAASEKIPTVCFADSGGAVEFVENDSGIIANGFSIDEMINAVESCFKNPLLVEKLGMNAFLKVNKKHQNPDSVLSQLSTVL